jgi:hypothetical protein
MTPSVQPTIAAGTDGAPHSGVRDVAEATEQQPRMLPRESAVVLMCFGFVDLLFLDPVGLFFVLTGALAFTPRLFQRTERWVQGRYPRIQREGRRHIDRFIDAFERRYPPDSR